MFDAGEGPILTADGSTYVFGVDASWGFHEDLIFAAAPGTGSGQTFAASYRLTDAAGVHAAGEVFTLNFVTVPEPGMGLLAAGGLAAVMRRRRAACQSAATR